MKAAQLAMASHFATPNVKALKKGNMGQCKGKVALTPLLHHIKTSCISSEPARVKVLVAKLVVLLDKHIHLMLREICTHTVFNHLKASWINLRSLVYHNQHIDKNKSIKVKLLNCRWNELRKSLNKAPDIEQSEFFNLIYTKEFDTPGGEPYGLIVADFYVGSKVESIPFIKDTETLKYLSRICAAAFSPMIIGVNPAFFGVEKFKQLATVNQISNFFSHPQWLSWHQLRAMPESKFLGLVIPNVLVEKRNPHLDRLPFDESSHDNGSYKDLWGNGIYAFASLVIETFAKYSWFSNMKGVSHQNVAQGKVEFLTPQYHEYESYRRCRISSVNLSVTDRLESILSDEGFIPICYKNHAEEHVFYGNNSVHKLANDVNVNDAKIGSMLQYTLCVSRIAHYIKILFRSKVGSFINAMQCQEFLQKWLNKYTSAAENSSDELKSRFPLKSAVAKVSEQHTGSNKYFAKLYLQPHFQFDQLSANIKLVTELTNKA